MNATYVRFVTSMPPGPVALLALTARRLKSTTRTSLLALVYRPHERGISEGI
jgi:hypothetical protein